MDELTNDQIDNCWDGLMPSGCGKSRYDIAHAIIKADRQLRQGNAAMPIFGGEICSKHDGVTSFCIARSKKDADDWESNGFVVNRLVRLSDAQAAIAKDETEAYGEGRVDEALEAQEHLTRLAAEVERLKKDAARYIYIKQQMETGAVRTDLPLTRSLFWVGTYVDCSDISDADASIDAAMTQEVKPL